MLDFMKVATRTLSKSGITEVFPKFIMKKSNDLMVRGKDFYAIWDNEQQMWSTDEDDVIRLVDAEIEKFITQNCDRFDTTLIGKYMWDSDSGSIDKFHKYCQKQMRDNYTMLDEELIFSNTKPGRENFASKRLSYPLEEGNYDAWDRIIGTLYSDDERHKIEWCIGSIVSGDSRKLQKFMVLYGAAGTGKSTILNIVQQLFEGYYSTFDAKALGSANNAFALEPFKTNPLVAIQHDGDLSRIEDNTRLNSLVSHERMSVNEKFKGLYETSFKCFLFMGTNRPVKITDGKSGLLRRLIDVHPTGNKIPGDEYKDLMAQIPFELGGIAYHCLQVYEDDPAYYDEYIPKSMLGASNDFYNFVCDSYSVFKNQNGTTLKAAWEMYKTYCDDAKVSFPFSKRNFKEELKNYFWDYDDRIDAEDGSRLLNYYSQFRTDIFENEIGGSKKKEKNKDKVTWIDLKEQPSIFDELCKDCPAQYATVNETPGKPWDSITTKLSDLDTSKLHYVKLPENHIVIDFDIKDDSGNKSLEKNLEAASKWPPTYAEVSKGGQGLHLHYIYNGDPTELSGIYDEDIEIKVFTGKSSLRRKLIKCVNHVLSVLSSGLPLKGVKKLVNIEGIQNEKHLRSIIKKHLNKEIMHNTKPSIDMIKKCLDEAYESKIGYDLSDMKGPVIALAASSTNQADTCMKIVGDMKFKSEDVNETVNESDSDCLVFYDIEIFPNLFLVCYKMAGENKPVVAMVNPKSSDIENLVRFKLVDFNGRKYDRHLLYARMMGYTVEELYDLSQRIINAPKGSRDSGLFSEAYKLGYTDVYDFAAKKQSLKKWEIELGIGHKELGLPWDKPVPEELWSEVIKYCKWDVTATEKVFDHLQGDFTARKILANLAGGTVNDTTNSLTTKIIFGNERHPSLVYTDLATGEQYGTAEDEIHKEKPLNAFPGYEFIQFGEDRKPHNMYRGIDLGFGGYIRSNAGIYINVALLDIQSLHPNSAVAMNYFGVYTQHFKDILDARVAIKQGDFETARHMLGGRLAPFLDDEGQAADLAQALKIAINSVYGLTSAKFDNPFRDSRNKNNIVALRGALFMKTLQDEVEKRGFKIVAIKTDSIKIANATKEIVAFCIEFAKKYSYTFEFEAFYDRICQINDADYIARYKDPEYCEKTFGFVPKDNKKHPMEWTATGKQFAVPYVFKTLFSKESIKFEDLCETFSVKSALYLDMNEKLPDVSEYEKEFEKLESKYKKGQLSDTTFESECARLNDKIAEGHDYRFVGKVGQFTPIKAGEGGGVLVRKQGEKYYAAANSTGYRWVESDMIKDPENHDKIDLSFYRNMVDKMLAEINQYGDAEWFTSDDPYIDESNSGMGEFMNIPADVEGDEMPFDYQPKTA